MSKQRESYMRYEIWVYVMKIYMRGRSGRVGREGVYDHNQKRPYIHMQSRTKAAKKDENDNLDNPKTILNTQFFFRQVQPWSSTPMLLCHPLPLPASQMPSSCLTIRIYESLVYLPSFSMYLIGMIGGRELVGRYRRIGMSLGCRLPVARLLRAGGGLCGYPFR